MWVADLGTAISTPITPTAHNTKDFDTLYAYGETMWVADGSDDKTTPTRFRGATAAGLRHALRGGQPQRQRHLYGIWSDGKTMWVTDSSDDRVYAYRMSDKTHRGGKDFDTLSAAGNRNPYGIWSDGETMWVVDVTDDKVYSYNMPPSDDATLSGPHRQPQGHHRVHGGPDCLRGRRGVRP